MADQKISELTALASGVSIDYLPVVDVSATELKRITIADLFYGSLVRHGKVTVPNSATGVTCAFSSAFTVADYTPIVSLYNPGALGALTQRTVAVQRAVTNAIYAGVSPATTDTGVTVCYSCFYNA